VVASYVVSAIGIPIYLHYCGGELEKINYVVKGTSCCGEEEDSEPMDEGCCKDENIVLKNNPDFTLKQFNNYALIKTVSEIFYISLPFYYSPLIKNMESNTLSIEAPPPKLQASLVISTSVLRI
jgi:hypothetical protein